MRRGRDADSAAEKARVAFDVREDGSVDVDISVRPETSSAVPEKASVPALLPETEVKEETRIVIDKAAHVEATAAAPFGGQVVEGASAPEHVKPESATPMEVDEVQSVKAEQAASALGAAAAETPSAVSKGNGRTAVPGATPATLPCAVLVAGCLNTHVNAGQRADVSFLDPINVEDAPAEAVRLAVGELAVRIHEERRRREVGLAGRPDITIRGMSGIIGMRLSDLFCTCCIVYTLCSSLTFVLAHVQKKGFDEGEEPSMQGTGAQTGCMQTRRTGTACCASATCTCRRWCPPSAPTAVPALSTPLPCPVRQTPGFCFPGEVS